MNLKRQRSWLGFRSYHYTVIDATEVTEFLKEVCSEKLISSLEKNLKNTTV